MPARWPACISAFTLARASAVPRLVNSGSSLLASWAGCDFSFDLDAKAAPLRKIVPEWTLKRAETAASSTEAYGGFVQIDTSYASLVDAPLEEIVARAAKGHQQAFDSLVERNPFAGIAAERPVRALAALGHAVAELSDIVSAWQTFLGAQARRSDKRRLAALIAWRLMRLPGELLAQIGSAAASWLRDCHKLLLGQDWAACRGLWSRLVPLIRAQVDTQRSARVRRGRPRWAEEAINTPTGHLAEVLMDAPTLVVLTANSGLPEEWIGDSNMLLSFPGDGRRFSLVLFGTRLNFLFAVDPVWTEASLLPLLDQDSEDRDALLAGFFWRPHISGRTFYSRMKPTLFARAMEPSDFGDVHQEVVGNLILDGWRMIDDETEERWVSDNELRNILIRTQDEFRTRVLWQVEHWPSTNEKIGFLTEVWPKQKVAKSPVVSRNLLRIALRSDTEFMEVADAILPLVSEVEDRNLAFTEFHDPQWKVPDRFPEKLLALLWAVLPANPSLWPYQTVNVLQRLGAADQRLLRDERLIELNRRWNAR